MCDNEYNTWHVYETYDDPESISGAKYVDDWRTAMENLGVTIMTLTTAIDLEQADDGSISAVICSTDKGDIKIETKAVVMATGGYGDNPQMVTELTGMEEGNICPWAAAGEAASVSPWRAQPAARSQMPREPACSTAETFQESNMERTSTARPHFSPSSWVNQNGVRFINEWYAERNFNFSGNGQSKQKKVFSIVTKSQMDKMANEGGWFGCGEYIHAGEPLTKLWEEYNEQKDAGNAGIFEGETLDDIAEQTGLPADALKAEVEHYNEMCAAGKDDEFSKDPKFLIPLEEGPYYCFQLQTGFFTTVGGMKVNDKAQVLNDNDEPIVGLYAAGCDAGGLYARLLRRLHLPRDTQQAWCVQSGKVAAEDAAQLV